MAKKVPTRYEPIYDLIALDEDANCNVHQVHGHTEGFRPAKCKIMAIGATDSYRGVAKWTCLDCFMASYPGFGTPTRALDWMTRQAQTADKIMLRIERARELLSTPPYAAEKLEGDSDYSEMDEGTTRRHGSEPGPGGDAA